MGNREKFLRVVDMKGCGWIPCRVGISQLTWHKYREKLENITLKHPRLFPSFKRGTMKFDDFGIRRKGNTLIDPWGCVWFFNIDGLQGQVVKHPLGNWAVLRDYTPPNPDDGIANEGQSEALSWAAIEKSVKNVEGSGGPIWLGMPHGFFFQRLYYLRGFTNLMRDFVTEPPELTKIIEIITEYNLAVIDRLLKFKPDIISFGDDLGMQDRMPFSEAKFRKFIYPSYSRIFKKVEESGTRVYLHTDGHIMEIAEDLLRAGVSILNIQDRVNGIDNIAARLKGRVCIDLDIDRQYIVPHGTPEMILNHVKEVVLRLGSGDGGLMLYSEIHAEVPLENINAVCRALESYMNYYGE